MEAAAVAFGDREAYDDGSRRLTFTRRGDVVAIAPPPLIDYAIAYAGIVRVGAVASGLNLRLRPREVTALCGCAPPVLAFVDERAPLAGLPEVTERLTRTRARGCAELLAEALDAMTEWIAAA